MRVSGTVTVTVRGDTAQVPPGTPPGAEPVGVDDMFALILDGRADAVTVTYDPRSGYPTSLLVDRITGAIDDEIGFEVRDYSSVG